MAVDGAAVPGVGGGEGGGGPSTPSGGGGGGGGGGGQGGGGVGSGRMLLAALNRVFSQVEAAVMRLVSISGSVSGAGGGGAEAEDMLRSLFVVKIEALQVLTYATSVGGLELLVYEAVSY
jgi:hypothetical protein